MLNVGILLLGTGENDGLQTSFDSNGVWTEKHERVSSRREEAFDFFAIVDILMNARPSPETRRLVETVLRLKFYRPNQSVVGWMAMMLTV